MNSDNHTHLLLTLRRIALFDGHIVYCRNLMEEVTVHGVLAITERVIGSQTGTLRLNPEMDLVWHHSPVYHILLIVRGKDGGLVDRLQQMANEAGLGERISDRKVPSAQLQRDWRCVFENEWDFTARVVERLRDQHLSPDDVRILAECKALQLIPGIGDKSAADIQKKLARYDRRPQ